MDTRSSTSSSEPAWPRAVVLAALMLAGLELGVRAWHPSGTVPYELGVAEYAALQPELDAFGSRNVSLVGSSHTREAVLAPQLAAELSRALGRRLSVGNYGLAGASAEEVQVVVRRLVEARPRPQLILYTMSPRQLSTKNDGPSPNVLMLWRVSDWWRSRSIHGAKVDGLLPDAVRNELAERSHLFRLRTEIHTALFSPGKHGTMASLTSISARRAQPALSPMQGELPPWKRGPEPNQSLRVSARRVRQYLEGRYDDPHWPNTYQLAFVERAVRVCRDAGVPLVLAELPAAPILLEQLRPGVYASYAEAIARLAARHSVPFVRLHELGVSFVQRDFIEQSHMNLRGATKYTQALALRLSQLGLPGALTAER